MQKLLIGLFAVTSIALGAVCLVQHRQMQAQRQEAQAVKAALQVETEARKADATRIQELARNEARLEEQVQQFTKVTTALRASESSQSSNLTKMAQQVAAARKVGGGAPGGDTESGALGKGMGEMLGQMMKDPGMREMLREQQKASVNLMYAGLFREMKLTPEEKDKLKELMAEAQMRNVEAAQGMMGGEKKDSATAQEAKKQIEAANKETEAQIKTLLGDERFAEYKDYQQNIGERMQLDQFGMRLKTSNMSLDDQQTKQMLQIMKEEKTVTPPVFPSDPNEAAKSMEMMTSENIDRQLKWMEDYNKRVADKAALVLSPEQYHEYQEFLKQQASMQKLGLQMARQMFGGEKKAEPAK